MVNTKTQVVRGLHQISVLALMLLVACAVGCGSGSKYVGEGYGGQGEGASGAWTYTLTISKDGDEFVVNVTGQGYHDGKHICKLVDGVLKFPDPSMNEAKLSSDGNTIYWAGRDYHKK